MECEESDMTEVVGFFKIILRIGFQPTAEFISNQVSNSSEKR